MNPTFKSILLVIIALTVVSACNNTKTDTTIDNSHGTVDKNVTIKSLTLKSNATTVNVAEHIELSVIGTYLDGSNKAINKNITYTITPKDSAEINNTTLIAKKDGNVTVQATVNGVNSNSISLTITWVVNGHVLPPEPDPAVNNATLLGVDVNDNGVRDDVERWIYREYKDKHPIYIDISMQEARGNKLVLEHPEKAKEIYPEVEKAIDCQTYYMYFAKYYGDPILIKEDAIDEHFTNNIYFNTSERMDAYDKYDKLLSGDSYALPTHQERKAACDFNTSKYED